MDILNSPLRRGVSKPRRRISFVDDVKGGLFRCAGRWMMARGVCTVAVTATQIWLGNDWGAGSEQCSTLVSGQHRVEKAGGRKSQGVQLPGVRPWRQLTTTVAAGGHGAPVSICGR